MSEQNKLAGNEVIMIKKYVGNLTIASEFDAEKYADIEEVTGYLYIGVDAALPVLASVGGDLYTRADANVSLPALASVGGGYLSISVNTPLPALEIAHGVKGRMLAQHGYGLWMADDSTYYAGCQGPLTKSQAIALGEIYYDKETANIFITAILDDDRARNTTLGD